LTIYINTLDRVCPHCPHGCPHQEKPALSPPREGLGTVQNNPSSCPILTACSMTELWPRVPSYIHPTANLLSGPTHNHTHMARYSRWHAFDKLSTTQALLMYEGATSPVQSAGFAAAPPNLDRSVGLAACSRSRQPQSEPLAYGCAFHQQAGADWPRAACPTGVNGASTDGTNRNHPVQFRSQERNHIPAMSERRE
jgi:hypothetical protein